MRTAKSNSLSFIDALSVASFFIGLENLDLNITQEDVQEVAAEFNRRFDTALIDIHKHLELQDAKLNNILVLLREDRRDAV